jgi:hypothetical protein
MTTARPPAISPDPEAGDLLTYAATLGDHATAARTVGYVVLNERHGELVLDSEAVWADRADAEQQAEDARAFTARERRPERFAVCRVVLEEALA